MPLLSTVAYMVPSLKNRFQPPENSMEKFHMPQPSLSPPSPQACSP